MSNNHKTLLKFTLIYFNITHNYKFLLQFIDIPTFLKLFTACSESTIFTQTTLAGRPPA
jgi:hypothetical protein